MAKKHIKKNEQLTKDWHDSVVDDTPGKKFVPKEKIAKKFDEEADFNTHNLYEDNYVAVPVAPAATPETKKPEEFIWTKDVSQIQKILAVNDTINGTLYKGKPK